MMQVCGKEIRIDGRVLRIARLEGDGYEFIEGNPESMLESLRKSDSRIDMFTFMQRLPELSPKYHYSMEWDNFAALPVTTFDHWWTQQIGFKARNKAKQAAKKGVVIREVPFDDTLVKGIWEVYNECPMRQGRRFWHYGKDLKRVFEEEATYLDRSIFIGAFLGEQMIGFIKLVADETGTQAGMMNIVSMIAHRDKAPTNALVAHAVQVCAERNYRYLVYSQFAYGNKTQSSITEFKERNGFQKIDVPRYYVPLTVAGKAALQLGLHKRFVERVPESILVKLRSLRGAWYRWRFQSTAAELS